MVPICGLPVPDEYRTFPLREPFRTFHANEDDIITNRESHLTEPKCTYEATRTYDIRTTTFLRHVQRVEFE